MYIKSFILNLILFIPNIINAQLVSSDRSMTDERVGSKYFTEIKPKLENPNSKSYFYDNDWQIGSIYDDEKTIVENKPLKYDIVREWLEIRLNEDIMILPVRKIDSFEWYNTNANYKSKFLPANNFKMPYEENTLPVGFLEVLVDGEVKLLAHKNVRIFQANTSVSVTGSHRSHDIIYVTKFYLAKDDTLYPIHKRRKKNLHLFGEYSKKIKKFYKKNGLLTRRKPDLMQIILYYNSLLIKDS